MKNLMSLLFIIILSTTTSFGQNKKFEDFRGLEWGSSMFDENMVKINNTYIELTLQKKENRKSYYTFENEDLTIGTANLEMIYYIFDEDGKFCGLDIEGHPTSKDDMIFILENKYGISPVYVKNSQVKYRKWKTKNDVILKLYENEDDDYILNIRDKSTDDFDEINSNVTDF